jgi:5-methylcytosine-specific restriction enzyme A
MGDNPAHNPWYSTSKWQRRRRDQLRREPLCAMCLANGLPVPANVADHKRAHKGDANSFWFGELQSLCSLCHSGVKQREEYGQHPPGNARPYRLDVGEDGWPLDPAHPANVPRQSVGGRGRQFETKILKVRGVGGRLEKFGSGRS